MKVSDFMSKLVDSYQEIRINEYKGNEHTGRRYVVEKHSTDFTHIPKDVWDAEISMIVPYCYSISIEVEAQEAVLIERDYKGEYERYALTPKEFEFFYGAERTREEGTFTMEPMVHYWYKSCLVGDNMWNQFFSNMTWGLSESDIEDGNTASVRKEMAISLAEYL